MDDKQPAAPAEPVVEDQKTYNLTPGETQLLILVQQNQNSIFSIILSHIANSRLAYPVGERTQFVLNGTATELKIGELKEQLPEATVTPPETPTATADQPAPAAPAPQAPVDPLPADSPIQESSGNQIAGEQK